MADNKNNTKNIKDIIPVIKESNNKNLNNNTVHSFKVYQKNDIESNIENIDNCLNETETELDGKGKNTFNQIKIDKKFNINSTNQNESNEKDVNLTGIIKKNLSLIFSYFFFLLMRKFFFIISIILIHRIC